MFFAKTDVANQELIGIETQVLNASHSNSTLAVSLISGPTYAHYKAILADGLNDLDVSIASTIQHQKARTHPPTLPPRRLTTDGRPLNLFRRT